MDPDLGQLRLEYSTWPSGALAGTGRDLRGHGGGAGSPDGRQRRPQRTKTGGSGSGWSWQGRHRSASEPFPPITAGAGARPCLLHPGVPRPRQRLGPGCHHVTFCRSCSLKLRCPQGPKGNASEWSQTSRGIRERGVGGGGGLRPTKEACHVEMWAPCCWVSQLLKRSK